MTPHARVLEALDRITGERVAVKLWREGKPMAGRIPAGNLGVVVDKRKLADALAAWRDRESKLLVSRGGKEWEPYLVVTAAGAPPDL